MTILIRNIIRSGINAINSDDQIVIVRQQGFTVSADGTQVPVQSTPEAATAQIQPTPTSELEHINNYNSSSTYYDCYLNGDYNSLRKQDGQGGDLFYFYGSNKYSELMAHTILNGIFKLAGCMCGLAIFCFFL